MSVCPREAAGVASDAKVPLRKTQPKVRQLTRPGGRLHRGAILRSCARVFGLSRDTIAKMCRYSAPPGYVRSKAPERSKLGPLVPVIDAIPEADKTAPPKQRHTAKRIFERVRIEHGFAGGYLSLTGAAEPMTAAASVMSRSLLSQVTLRFQDVQRSDTCQCREWSRSHRDTASHRQQRASHPARKNPGLLNAIRFGMSRRRRLRGIHLLRIYRYMLQRRAGRQDIASPRQRNAIRSSHIRCRARTPPRGSSARVPEESR